MASNAFSEGLTDDQKNLSVRIFDVISGRILRRVYASLDQKTKDALDATFLADDDAEKEKFIKKYIPNFKTLFNEELKKIEADIKAEIEKEA